VLLAVVLLYPDFIDAVLFSIRTINVLSEEGFSYTGELRLVQLHNIFLNMVEVPFTFITGFGIGPQWHVLEPLPTTLDEVGSYMAYDAKTMSQSSDYLPYFHIIYFASIFRFGLVGFMLLTFIAYRFTVSSCNIASQCTNINRKILTVGITSLSILPILYLGDNAAVTTWISLGINFGLIRSINLSIDKRNDFKENGIY
jgi:hypothetical protein